MISGGYISAFVLLLIIYTFLDIRHLNQLMTVSYYLKFALLAVGIVATVVFVTLIPLGRRDQVSDCAAVFPERADSVFAPVGVYLPGGCS